MIESIQTPAKEKPRRWISRGAQPACKAPRAYATGAISTLPGLDPAEHLAALSCLDKLLAAGLVTRGESLPEAPEAMHTKSRENPSQAAIHKRRQRAKAKQLKAATVDPRSIATPHAQ